MNVESAKYNQYDSKLIEAVIDGQKMSVPEDDLNRQYRAIQAWVAAGNTIVDADPIPSD